MHIIVLLCSLPLAQQITLHQPQRGLTCASTKVFFPESIISFPAQRADLKYVEIFIPHYTSIIWEAIM